MELKTTMEAASRLNPIRKGQIMRGGGIAATVAVGAYIFANSWFQTDAGYTYIYQNNLTGSMAVYTEPGVHMRVPFFSRLTEYRQVTTISFGSSGEDLATSPPPITVRFADTYTGEIPASFRFRLSPNPEKMLQMHREFRSFNNLVEAMLVKNARNVVVITATQYTGEEFFQGGLNQFKAKLEDQLRAGIYLTERKQVEVEQTDLAPVGLDQNDPNKLQSTRQLVWKTVPVLDANGQPRRQNDPLDAYGIEVTQVTVGDPVPEKQLDRLLSDKKALVAERIRTIQEQETAKAQAKTEQLKKEIERTRAVQDAQRTKELAVIAQQQEVEVARQIAARELVEYQKQKDVAEIEKAKELAIAQSNLNIQRANAEAAKHEAQAILEKGQAEARVLAVKYSALGANKQVYLAEMQRDVAQAMYQNLANFKIEMPHNYIGGSADGGGLKSNLDVLTAYGALGVMDQVRELKAAPVSAAR